MSVTVELDLPEALEEIQAEIDAVRAQRRQRESGH